MRKPETVLRNGLGEAQRGSEMVWEKKKNSSEIKAPKRPIPQD